MDTRNPEQRRHIMRSVGQKHTKPERIVRRLLHKLGFRFRLHPADLPGKPDIILPKYATVVLVHGCFWHSCPHCGRGRPPKSNQNYWIPKLQKNQERDKRIKQCLTEEGLSVIEVWECQTKNDEALRSALAPLLTRKHLSKSPSPRTLGKSYKIDENP